MGTTRGTRWLPVCALALAACGDNAAGPRTLTIVAPITAVELCLAQDLDADQPGIQLDVRVAAPGFDDGDEVRVSIDGAEPVAPGAAVAGEVVTFPLLTLPEGFHTLVARSADGTTASVPVIVFIESDAPSVTITAPVDRTSVPASADVDPGAPGIQVDVEIDAGVEDGQAATITVISADGDESEFSGAVTGRRATVRVTLPQGTTTLRAAADTSCGNQGTTEVAVAVNGASPVGCALELTPLPGMLPGDRLVYNQALDADAADGFQLTATVRTRIGGTAEVEIDGALVASALATDDGSGRGVATFPLTVPEGARIFGAECIDRVGTIGRSPTRAVLVDVTPPVCAVTSPAGGAILLPDPPGGTTREVRVDVTVSGDGDTDGEEAIIAVAGDAETVTIQGIAGSRIVTLGAPDDALAITVAGRDHAGNPCAAEIGVSYVSEGCSLEWLEPAGVVVADASGSAGLQTQVRARLGAACAGKTVTLDGCDVGGPRTATASAGPDPEAVFDITVCPQAVCQGERTCTLSVTRDGPVTTTLEHTLAFDTSPPAVTVVPLDPAVPCGSAVTAASDVSGDPGVQVRLLVMGDVVSRTLAQTPTPATTPVVAGDGTVTVTLSMGQNSFVATGTDAAGLVGTSPTCRLRLSNMNLTIDDPAASARLGSEAGAVVGDDLSIQVCGTVGEAAEAVVVVRVDDGPEVTATVDTGTGAWCAAGVVLAPGDHVIHALATAAASGHAAEAEVDVSVEIEAPDAASALTITPLDRRSVEVAFVEPADDDGDPVTGCAIKRAGAPIPDDAAWRALPGDGIPVGGGSPGEEHQTIVFTRPGRPAHFAVRCTDDFGNLSPVVTTAGVTTDLSAGLEIAAPDVAGWITGSATVDDVPVAGGFGATIVGADLDGDGTSDLVVSAPGAVRDAEADPSIAEGLVFVFMGRDGGITQAEPDYILTGDDDALFGNGLTVVDWNDDGVDDLAIGAPFARGFQGEVAVFYGGAGWQPQAQPVTVAQASAGARMFTDDTELPLALFGWAVARSDFDGDGRDDLVVGANGHDDFAGGVFVLYATGTPPASLSVPGGLGAGVVATLFEGFPAGKEMGSRLYPVGPIDGDAAEEIAVGHVPTLTFAGGDEVFVFHGRARPGAATPLARVAATTAQARLVGPSDRPDDFDTFGGTLTSISDQTGDGVRDLVVGHWSRSSSTGSLYLFAGGTPGTQPAAGAAMRIDGRDTGHELGIGLAVSGEDGADLDGDGVEDLVTCASHDAADQRPRLFGWYGGEDPDLLVTWEHAAPSPWIRCSTASWVGDLNQDGLPDIVWADAGLRFQPWPRAGVIQVLY